MQALIEMYNQIHTKVSGLRTQMKDAEANIAAIDHKHGSEIPERIDRLKEQITKADEYLLKIAGFRKLAEENLTSKNVQTYEAPKGYRVNLNRLRSWSMMIDRNATDCPYAQRVLLTAKCDALFLSKKKQEFQEKINMLTSDGAQMLSAEVEEQRQRIAFLKTELANYAGSNDVRMFAEAVRQESRKHWHEDDDSLPFEFVPAKSEKPDYFVPGAYHLALDFEQEQASLLSGIFGRHFDEKNMRVLLPLSISTSSEYVFAITCTPSRNRELDRGIQNLILNTVNKDSVGATRVYVLDAARFSSVGLGFLKPMEGTFALRHVPRNPEQLTTTLEEIVSSFADLDEMLEFHDSVTDYNMDESKERKIPKTILVIYGWPTAFEGRDKELIQRILTNYERYGISIICVSFSASENKDVLRKGLPEYAAYLAQYINMSPKDTIIYSDNENSKKFVWYVLRHEVKPEYVASLKAAEANIDTGIIGNMFAKRVDVTGVPTYSRAYRPIELPFGVDSKDNVQYLAFENENFATYLVGASRSGKSTLIHTLISSIVLNYHPDAVELWLADFKQVEFEDYIKFKLPHVKYVLLDESTELVYNLVDKLTEIMKERQMEFQRLGSIKKLPELDYAKHGAKMSKPMPLIFVILDEFSIMSQVIAERQDYKLKLQNLLAKGAALGIRFLFASQSFTTGISGLTPTAKNQIQQRIAMKAPREEIVETLELTPTLRTEQVTSWVDALPVHYALNKFRDEKESMLKVRRAHVLYFKDEERRTMMQGIINRFRKVNKFNYNDDMFNFTDKNPVYVDGNRFDAFNTNGLKQKIAERKREGFHADEETLVTLGTPRLMSDMKEIVVTQESRENFLMISNLEEQDCAASILTSAMRSYIMQGKRVQIWAYDKNRMYAKHKNNAWKTKELANHVSVAEGIHAVCDAIYATKQNILKKIKGEDIIVLMGMDRICAEFEFIEGGTHVGEEVKTVEEAMHEIESEQKSKGAVAETYLQEMTAHHFAQWRKVKKSIEAQCKKEGKTPEETTAVLSERKAAFDAEKRAEAEKMSKEELTKSVGVEITKNPSAKKGEAQHASGEYNAMADFRYVLKQGSRNGYNFIFCLNDYADLKPTGLKLDLFKHRLAFQIPADDSYDIFRSKDASALAEHICMYYDTIDRFTFRPYIHKEINWDGWAINQKGEAINESDPMDIEEAAEETHEEE